MRIFSSAVVLLLAAVSASAVTLQFSTSDPTIGPFPADSFTIADAAQKTGKRINLPDPLPCVGPAAGLGIPTECVEVAQLNQLDGFHLTPRVRLKFSAPINADSLRAGVRFVALDNLTNDEYGINYTGEYIPINEVVYDPATNTAYFKPDIIIDQHRRFGILVTDAVVDVAGKPVQADPAFTACSSRQNIAAGDYCGDLTQFIASQKSLFSGTKAIGGSVFTTMSATATLESLRSRISSTPLNMQPVGDRSIFDLGDLSGVTVKVQNKTDPTAPTADTVFPSQLLAVSMRIAFGTFSSPSFLNAQLMMSDTPTNSPAPDPVTTQTLPFHLYLPTTAPPAGGYPVIIFGHGFADMSIGGPTVVAPLLTQAGFAIAAINAFGHGAGPKTTISFTDRAGVAYNIFTGGRGVDIDRNGTIDAFEGCVLPGLTGTRDCVRQTVVDLMQLTRLLRTGALDFGKSGVVNLDPNRIYYVGPSLGGIYGTIFSAVEPNVRASALNDAGGSLIEVARLSPSFHSIAAANLAARQSPLLNSANGFNDDYVGRWQPARVVTVPGAIDIQNYFERAEWYQMSGDPTAYAPHLRQSTLPGVPIKPILFQIARGDMTIPNPASSTLIRDAWMRDDTVIYRHDIARTVVPGLPDNPHTFLLNFSTSAELAIAAAAQAQIAGFLLSDGNTIPDPNPLVRKLLGVDLFETPAFLPEDPGFTVF